VWIAALKPSGYVIISAHESVPCDEILKPLVSCCADRRFGSPVTDEIVGSSAAPHAGWPIAIRQFSCQYSRHFIRHPVGPPVLSSPSARVRSVPGWSVSLCIRRAGEQGAVHHCRCPFPGAERGRYTRRNSRYGAIQSSLVLLNVVSSLGLPAVTNRTSGRHVLAGCSADR